MFFVPIALIIGLDSAFFIYSETQSGMTWTQIRRGHGSRELGFDRASSQYGSSTRVRVPMKWVLGSKEDIQERVMNYRATISTARSRNDRSVQRPGFSLIELLVVMAITGVLTALLVPTLSSIRESANRVISASNQRMIGQALTMYASDHKDRLPRSSVIDLSTPMPGELMAAHFEHSNTGSEENRRYQPDYLAGWDGIGLLYALRYVEGHEVFYCPSHEGQHQVERYSQAWEDGRGTIYTNYHYAGHKNWETGLHRRFANPERMVLLTDGLRRQSDLSHRTGLNVLMGDGSVRWHELPTLLARLPVHDPVGIEIRDHHDLINEVFNLNGVID